MYLQEIAQNYGMGIKYKEWEGGGFQILPLKDTHHVKEIARDFDFARSIRIFNKQKQTHEYAPLDVFLVQRIEGGRLPAKSSVVFATASCEHEETILLCSPQIKEILLFCKPNHIFVVDHILIVDTKGNTHVTSSFTYHE